MSTPKNARRALGLAVGVIVATPTLGCMEAHSPPATDAQVATDASRPPEDASVPPDAVAIADAGTPVDAAPAVDAFAETPDADAPDSYYYPDGVRG